MNGQIGLIIHILMMKIYASSIIGSHGNTAYKLLLNEYYYAMKVTIYWQNHQFRWIPYTSMVHLPTARRVATNRTRSTGRKHKIVDDRGILIDIINN
tara:strand:- start:783 stop:1073 length:291 start_codon:yes stop_codon:yes gene_type:complete